MASEYSVEEILGEGAIRFDRKVAESDGILYRVSEAEEADLRKVIENSCIKCDKLLGREEIKVIPPQYVQDSDRHVASGYVARRVMCTPCYEAMTSSTREMVRLKYRKIGSALRERLFKAIA
ncbi:MAG: hypothetical protein KGH59_03375, partial [Candidatus Micrarchaeota archaeon]|nr:hypothetical protein [Candidatus Micrarchaeota archaeon]